MKFKDLKKTYLTHSDKLSRLLDNVNFINLLNENVMLFDTFVEQVNLIFTLEKKLDTHKQKSKSDEDLILDKSTKLLAKLQIVAQAKSSNVVLTELDLENETEIVDLANYLNVFLNNTFKHSLDYYLDPKNFEKKVESVKAEQVNSTPFSTETNSASTDASDTTFDSKYKNTGSFFGGNPFDQAGSIPLTNEAILQTNIAYVAREKLKEEISSGKFYQFSSKPKIIPLIKQILFGLFAFSFLVLLTNVVARAIANNLQVNFFNDMPIAFFTARSQNFGSYLGIYSYFMIIINMVLLGYQMATLFSKTRNENIKYDFQKRKMIILLVFQIYYLIGFVTELANGSVGLLLRTVSGDNQSSNSEAVNISTQIFLYTVFVYIAFIVLNLVAIIFGWINSPKPDLARIQKKLEILFDEVKKNYSQKSQ